MTSCKFGLKLIPTLSPLCYAPISLCTMSQKDHPLPLFEWRHLWLVPYLNGIISHGKRFEGKAMSDRKLGSKLIRNKRLDNLLLKPDRASARSSGCTCRGRRINTLPDVVDDAFDWDKLFHFYARHVLAKLDSLTHSLTFFNFFTLHNIVLCWNHDRLFCP